MSSQSTVELSWSLLVSRSLFTRSIEGLYEIHYGLSNVFIEANLMQLVVLKGHPSIKVESQRSPPKIYPQFLKGNLESSTKAIDQVVTGVVSILNERKQLRVERK